MLIGKTPPVRKRCMFNHCHRDATYVHAKDKCFAFCDKHWPKFEQVMTHPRVKGVNRKRPAIGKTLAAEGKELIKEGMHPVLVAKRIGVNERTAYRWRTETNNNTRTKETA